MPNQVSALRGDQHSRHPKPTRWQISRRLLWKRCTPVVSTGRTIQVQEYRPGLVGPVLVGFQASLALLSNQAL